MSNKLALQLICIFVLAHMKKVDTDTGNSQWNNFVFFQSELDKLKLLHESKLKEWKLELQTKLQSLREELDDKWQDTLR